MHSIAIIPARSGSKGLKDKNIRILDGKPLMAYTIEAAINSGCFDTVHVSTDSERYAEIAVEFGADVPFLRSQVTSGDNSSSWEVVREVLKEYKLIGKEYDVCVLLQPTSPLRDYTEIQRAMEHFKEANADSLTSVNLTAEPVQMCFRLDDSLSMYELANSKFRNCRRQELDEYYIENGAIYIIKSSSVLREDFDFYSGKCIAFPMERNKSVDIDNELDFVIAESLIRYYSSKDNA